MEKFIVVERILVGCGYLGVPLNVKQIDTIFDVLEFTSEEKDILLRRMVMLRARLEEEEAR